MIKKACKGLAAILIIICTVIQICPVPTSLAADLPDGVSIDTVTGRNWSSKYGFNGYIYYNNWAAVSDLPGYIDNFNVTGGEIYSDLYFANNSFEISFDITDGNEHEIAILAYDMGPNGRVNGYEVFKKSDNSSLFGKVEVALTSAGVYLIFSASESIRIRVTREATVGVNAVFTGVYFNNTTLTQLDVGIDTSTGRDWVGKYGSDGYMYYENWNTVSDLPAYIDNFNVTGGTIYSDLYFASSYFEISFDITDGKEHEIALFAYDMDSNGRTNGVQAFKKSDGSPLFLETEVVLSGSGVYLVFSTKESMRIRVTRLVPSGQNAVFTGIFFSTFVPPKPKYRIDETTGTAWQGVYGDDGYLYYLSAQQVNGLPAYIENFQISGGQGYGPLYFSNNSITVSFDITDGKSHEIAIFSFDENNGGRITGIEAFSKATGLSLFGKAVVPLTVFGKYIIFDTAESIRVVITHEGPNNAVVSGFYFSTPVIETGIDIVPEDGELYRYSPAPFTMKATIKPEENANAQVRWSIEGGSASISAGGHITGLETGGIYKVTAEALDLSADQNIIIADPAAPLPQEVLVSSVAGFSIIENQKIKVVFDTLSGRYSAYNQDTKLPYVLNAYSQIEKEKSTSGYVFTAAAQNLNDEIGTGKALVLTGKKDEQNDFILQINMYSGEGFIVLANGIKNNASEPVRLKVTYPMVVESSQTGGIFAGSDPGDSRHDLLTGEGSFDGARVKHVIDAESPNTIAVSYREKPKMETFVLGGLTTFEFQNRIFVSYDEQSAFKNHDRKSIDAYIRVFDSTGKKIDEDSEPYMADKAFINFYEKNPYKALEDYGRQYAKAMHVKLNPYNQYVSACLWYLYIFDNMREANTADGGILEAQTMNARGMSKYATPYIRLVPDTYTSPENEQLWWDDAHWKKSYYNNSGQLSELPHLTDTYPTLKSFSDALKELGAVGGMYMQPNVRSDYSTTYPGQMLYGRASEGPDYTNRDFIAHLEDVYANIRNSDIKGMFYDYSYRYNGWVDILSLTGGFQDEYATAVSAYRNIFQIARDNTDEGFLITETPHITGHDVGIGLIDAQRSMGDNVSFNKPVIQSGVSQWYRNNVTKLLDPDVKQFDRLDDDVRRGQLTGMALMFGKTMLGSGIGRYSDQQIKDIGRIFPMPLYPVTARPLGLFEAPDTDPVIFDYIIQNGKDDHIILLYNTSAAQKTMSIDLGEDSAFGGAELNPAKEYEVWDFWNWKSVGRVNGDAILSLPVRANEMKTLAVREVDKPRILSTNRHVLQGEVDTTGVSFNSATDTLSGTLHVIGDDEYKAIVMLPDAGMTIDTFSVTNANVAAKAVKDPLEGYIEITINCENNEDVGFELKLKPGNLESHDVNTAAGFTSQAKGTAVLLSWLPGESENIWYKLYRGDSADFTMDRSTFISNVYGASYSDINLTPNTLYCYKLIACDETGNYSKEPAVLKIVTLDIFARLDYGTAGNWIGKYGSDGYVLYNSTAGADYISMPDYMEKVDFTGTRYSWTSGTTDGRALQVPPAGTTRFGRCLYGSEVTFTLTPKDNRVHSVSLYGVDFNTPSQGQRSIRISATDELGYEIIPVTFIENYSTGCYITFNYSGKTTIKVHIVTGPNAVISALFFDGEVINEPVYFSYGEEAATGIIPGKTLNVKAEYIAVDSEPRTMYAALYNERGALINLAQVSGAVVGDRVSFDVDIDIPTSAGSGAYIKVFVWNSQTYVPIRPAVILKN